MALHMKATNGMKFSPIMACIGCLLLLAACGPEPQIRNDRLLQDVSIISGEPCAAPCWRGITPGETTWNDALAILRDDDTLADVQTRADENNPNLIGAAWAQADGDGCCQMFTQNGEIVDFMILQTTPALRLSDIVTQYGEPSYLIGETLTSSQGVFTLLYPETPMMVYAFFGGEAADLMPESEIVGFSYLTPELMQFILDTSSFHDWEGYRSYQFYSEGEFEVTPSITLTPTPAS